MENFRLNLTILEKHLDLEDLSSIPIMVFIVITVGCIVIINSLLLNYLKRSNSTLINNLIICDCVVNLANIPRILKLLNGVPYPNITCLPMHMFTNFITYVNRLLPIGIVLYRYVYVCRHSWVLTSFGKRILDSVIVGLILGCSLFLVVITSVYKENYRTYLECVGRVFQYHFDVQDFLFDGREKGIVWILPFFHPVRVLCNLMFYSYIIIVPVGYFKIYSFTRNQATTVIGLNESSRLRRKRLNIVTTRFNLIIWILETVAPILFFLPLEIKLSWLVYNFVACCFSPFLYFVGIECNRLAVRNQVLRTLGVKMKDENNEGSTGRTTSNELPSSSFALSTITKTRTSNNITSS